MRIKRVKFKLKFKAFNITFNNARLMLEFKPINL
jgi:hypothetical protein